VRTKEKMYLLNSLQYSNFHVDEHVIQEMKKLTTFANWELLVPRLKTYNLSHVIIQSRNINSLHKHYQDLQHDHNLQTSHTLCLQETKIEETSHFDKKNIIILIYVFDNHNSAMMYDNNVTL
jgi:hypothetical protein